MSMSDTEFHSVESLEGVSNDADLDQFASEFFGENKEEEAPAKAPADDDKEDDAKKDDTLSEDDALAEDKEEDEEKDEPAPKPKTRSEKRIEDLNTKYRQEQREKAELQRQLDELKSGQQNKEPKTTTAKQDGPSPEDVNEDGTEKYPLGEFDPTYIRDLTRFTIAQEREADRAAAAAEAQQSKVTEAQEALAADWNAKLPEAVEKYPDFTEKGQELVESFSDLDPEYGSYLTETLMSMDHGTDVLYYLSTHPDEAYDIVNSGVRKATIALGRLEAQFSEKSKATEQRRVSNAPPPPPANKGLAPVKTTVADDTDDLSAFEKKFFKKRS